MAMYQLEFLSVQTYHDGRQGPGRGKGGPQPRTAHVCYTEWHVYQDLTDVIIYVHISLSTRSLIIIHSDSVVNKILICNPVILFSKC